MSVISQLLNILKDKIEKPIEWFAIIALVILVFEVKYLMFQLPKKLKEECQLCPQQLLRVYYASKWREIFLTLLSIVLAWALFFSNLKF